MLAYNCTLGLSKQTGRLCHTRVGLGGSQTWGVPRFGAQLPGILASIASGGDFWELQSKNIWGPRLRTTDFTMDLTFIEQHQHPQVLIGGSNDSGTN